MKTHSHISKNRIAQSIRAKFNPIKSLTPASLSRMLDNFHAGQLRPAALAWDAIERRDDVLQGVISKRKKSVSRLDWKILTLDDSTEAQAHKAALEYFYNNLSCTHACNANENGGLGLLIKHMMDSVGKKYAVHEIIFDENTSGLTASFKFVPLWFFEHTSGELKFLNTEHSSQGVSLEPGSWMVTHGDGLMEACSIAYLFKHLPLRDWLVYCERNGMPGVKGITDAQPGTQEWDAARDAVLDFGAEFNALMSRGTDIEPIDLTAKGTLPYPELIERMDRAMISLWRGSDLSTFSKASGTGASVQSGEAAILESEDAALISETLNTQIDRFVLKHLFGVERGKAYFKLMPKDTDDKQAELNLLKTLHEIGVPMSINDLAERFGIELPSKGETHI